MFEEQVVKSKERDERLKKSLLNDPQSEKISWSWVLLAFAGVILGIVIVAGQFLLWPIKNVFLFEEFW